VKTAILINRGGGSVGERRLIEEALASAGIGADIQWLEGADLPKAAKAAAMGGAKLVIAGGGDGTISCVAGALAGTRTKLGVLPLGTLNHFARDLGIPTKLEDAAKLLATGKARAVDVADVNGRVFVNNSAVGLYPLMVLDREAQQSQLGRSKRWAMAIAAARTLFRFSSRRLTLTVNDRTAVVDTPLLFVGNNAYKMDLPGAGTRAEMDRGELFVLVLRSKSRLGFCVASVRALFGRSRRDDVVRIEGVETLKVGSSRHHLAVSLDGETMHMKPPLEYRIRPKALNVVAP
jgi:YegS/Rv2252/BmrU family lipid kinase